MWFFLYRVIEGHLGCERVFVRQIFTDSQIEIVYTIHASDHNRKMRIVIQTELACNSAATTNLLPLHKVEIHK